MRQPPVTTGLVHRAVLAAIQQLAEGKRGLETGGLLIGYWTDDDRPVVTDVIGPGPGAVHLPRSFQPDHTWQSEQLANLYAQSGRRRTYLGDWHTHPLGSAEPSRTDRATLRRIAATPAARTPRPLMAIQGGRELCFWRHRTRRRVPQQVAMDVF
jgi:integrative and conjugative element protein (TIGR02256 family)